MDERLDPESTPLRFISFVRCQSCIRENWPGRKKRQKLLAFLVEDSRNCLAGNFTKREEVFWLNDINRCSAGKKILRDFYYCYGEDAVNTDAATPSCVPFADTTCARRSIGVHGACGSTGGIHE